MSFETIEKAFFGHVGRLGIRGGSAPRNRQTLVTSGNAVREVALRSKPKDYSFPSELGVKETKTEHTANGEYTKERQKLHNKIIDEFISAGGKSEAKPIAILTGGGTASGKSTMVRGAINPALERAQKKAVRIDSDEIKEAMPDYHQAKKDNVKTAAARVHEESSDIAKKILSKAIDNKQNLIFDGTMSNPQKYVKMVDRLKNAGYEVQAHVADVSIGEAMKRSNARALKTGREVPKEILVGTHQGVPHTVRAIRDKVDKLSVYDTTGDPTPFVTEKGVVHKERYRQFMKKGGIIVL